MSKPNEKLTNTHSDLSDSRHPKSTSSTFRLRDMFKPSFDLWLISWGLGLVTALSMIALLMVSGWFITGAALAGLIAVGSHSFNYMLPAGIIRMLAMSRTAGRYGELMVSHHAVFNLLKNLRLRFFNRLATLPLSLQRRTLNSAQYMHRLVNDIDKLNEFILRVITPWLVGSLSLILLALFICWLLPVNLAVKTMLLILFALSLIIPLFATYKGISQAKVISEVAEARRQKLLAPLSIISQLILWQQWQSQTQDYIHKDKELQQLVWQAQKQRSFYVLAIQIVLYLALFIVLFAVYQLTGSSLNANDIVSIPQEFNVPILVAVALGLLGIQEIIVPLGQHYLSLGSSIAAKERLNDLLTSHPVEPLKNSQLTFLDSDDLDRENIESENIETDNFNFQNKALYIEKLTKKSLPLPQGELRAELSHVDAKLPKALVGAQNVSASLRSGQPLLIQGPSGCGKSTLLQALAGELAISAGTITLNGQNWFDYDWQDQLGYLGQHLDIFDQSLAANLRLGKPDATDSELISILDKVGLLDWLKQQPQGLNTPLGEYGAAISGGQARRIALARLLLKPRRVLLLDEPFAGLDTLTRDKVWQSVREHQKNGLLIIVSHHQWEMGAHDTLTLSEGVFVA